MSAEPVSFAARYGPWALVAGGSEGIGLAFAHRIAAAGVSVALVARRAETLDAAARELRAVASAAHRDVEVRTLALDLTADDALARIRAGTDDLDVGLLVYNAGATHGVARFHDAPVERALSLVALDCIGPVRLAHHFGARMRERRRGGIVLLSSVSGTVGSALTAAYSACKAFDLVLAEGLWAELRPFGVDVLGLVAGATRTPAMERSGALIGTDPLPGMDADDVAREGLERLPHGPSWVAGEANRKSFEMLRGLPRKSAVKALSAGARAVYGLEEE
ncbi:MAG: SDR family NAD(P)-dependent oxidoreductase [Myxococcota bacterium]